jgi:hypothetical protein
MLTELGKIRRRKQVYLRLLPPPRDYRMIKGRPFGVGFRSLVMAQTVGVWHR